MFKFNRKTEYGLIALRYLATHQQGDQIVSTREIAETYRLPYAILSKVLQKLQRRGLVQSVQGTHGGYRLVLPQEQISVGKIVEIFEGPHGVTNCLGAKTFECALNDICNVKSLFGSIQNKIHQLLAETTLDALVEQNEPSKRSAYL